MSGTTWCSLFWLTLTILNFSELLCNYNINITLCMHAFITSFCSTWGYRSWQQVHCLWNKGHWNQSTIFHSINVLLLWGVPTKVLAWCHVGSHFDSDVSYILDIALPVSIWYFPTIGMLSTLDCAFQEKDLCYLKIEGTSGEFPCSTKCCILMLYSEWMPMSAE